MLECEHQLGIASRRQGLEGADGRGGPACAADTLQQVTQWPVFQYLRVVQQGIESCPIGVLFVHKKELKEGRISSL